MRCSLLVVELSVMQRLEIPSHHGPGVCVAETQRHLAPAQSAALLQRLTDGLRQRAIHAHQIE